MKVRHLFLISCCSQYFIVARLLSLLVVVVILWPQNAEGQQASIPKLTLSQVEGLVSHHVPDSTMQTEIQRRGLAFTPNPAVVESLRAKGAGPLTLAAIEAFFLKATPSVGSESKPFDKDLPKPMGYVSDFAHVLSPEAVARMDRICGQLDHSRADAQVAVVTIHSLEGADVADYAKALFNNWGIGRKGSDRGVLVLLAVNDRKWRIDVGDGLVSILPNAKVGDVGRDMIPLLRANDFDGAITLAVSHLAQVIAADAKMTLDDTPGAVQHQSVPPGSPVLTHPTMVNISADVAAGLLLQKTTPSYPQLAKQTHIQGQVVLQVEISKDGTIQNLKLISGHPMLAPAAIEAVKQWRYNPYLIDGEPVAVNTQVVVNFSLSGG
jgi:TonB family protein